MSSTKLNIINPRRILLVGTPGSGKLSFLKALTGSLPSILSTAETHAGLSHSLSIKNTYYEVELPIWIDEIPKTTLSEWAAGYCGVEAKEVLEVIGAFIVTFRKPQDKDGLSEIKKTLAAMQEVVKGCGYAWDGVCLAVAMPQSLQPHLEMGFEDWEEVAREYQFEYVDFESRGLNEYGDAVGMGRIKEALDANDWSGTDGDYGGSFGSFEDDEDSDIFDPLKPIGDEMEREMFGLHDAITAGGGDGKDEDDSEEFQVEKLEATMMKLQALRELGPEEMTKVERQKLAKSVVIDIMKS